MNSEVTVYAVPNAWHGLFRFLLSFPIACFCGALVTDLTYTRTANVLWVDFSAWLLAIGEAFGLLAALAGVIDLATNRRVVPRRPAWPVALGGLAVLGLALLNNLVHSRDGWTAVMPEGLPLSALTVIAVLATAWFAARPMRRAIPQRSYGARS